MRRRNFLKNLSVALPGFSLLSQNVTAKTYMSVEEAKQALWGDEALVEQAIVLSKVQAKNISAASKTRVRNLKLNTWRSADGGWFIVDQVIGKHENIDIAVALSQHGAVEGIEVLVYRESYGHQIMHPKWRAQFNGVDHNTHMKLDRDVKNISGATLSCRHVTDGINRLTHTWQQVLSQV